MAKGKQTITINAPVEKVFRYWGDPTSLLEIWPSVVGVSDVQRLPNDGNRFRYVYKMAGMRFEGGSEDIEFVVNERIVSKTTGGIESTITATFQPKDGGTEMTVEVEYTVPIPLLGKLAESFILGVNERELGLMLANLKARMEV